jgi:hypothetical protein
MSSGFTVTSVIDEVNDWQMFGHHCCGRRVKLRSFLASRQGQPGAYAGLFAAMPGELDHGYRFHTGERIRTRAGSTHILGEEALRALILVEPETKAAQAAIANATIEMERRLKAQERARRPKQRWTVGCYCCGRCSVAVWRALAVGAYSDPRRRLAGAMKALRTTRDGKGTWRGLPFYYTLSALVEVQERVGIEESRAELRYTRPAVENRLARLARDGQDVHVRRRRAICERALAAA